MTVFDGLRSVIEIVPDWTASENVAATVVDVAIPVAPDAGAVLATVGGVVSGGGGADDVKFTSTK